MSTSASGAEDPRRTQVAAFASFTGDEEKLAMCRKRYKEILLPRQMADDGSFPRELKRTKLYGYSLFNADAMASVCKICSMNGGIAYHQPQWLDTWERLDANPTNEEVLRNLPIRHPVLWVD